MSGIQLFIANNNYSIATVGVLSFAVLIVWLFYNRLAALDERCDTVLTDIDALLKHRHDLIPGLVESVRAFAGHESAAPRYFAPQLPLHRLCDNSHSGSTRRHETLLASEREQGHESVSQNSFRHAHIPSRHNVGGHARRGLDV